MNNQPKISKGAFFISMTLFLLGVIIISVGAYEQINPYSISVLDDFDSNPNPNPIIPPINYDDPDDPDDIPTEDPSENLYPNGIIGLQDYFFEGEQYYLMIWVNLDNFEGYLLIANSNDSVYFDGQWWNVPLLQHIIDDTIPDSLNINNYIDGYVNDEANAHDDATEPDDGGYDPEPRKTIAYFFIGGSVLLSSIIPLMIRKENK